MAQDVQIETKKGFNLITFFRETEREAAKVTWPTRRETLMMTVMIIVMALVVGIFFFGVDSALGFAISHVLGMNS
jgi:preprotein translocase subunit SecE